MRFLYIRPNLFRRRNAHPLHGTEFFEQRRFAPLADVGKFVEDAFRNALETQLRVVGVREAMRFVADALQEFQRALECDNSLTLEVAGGEKRRLATMCS